MNSNKNFSVLKSQIQFLFNDLRSEFDDITKFANYDEGTSFTNQDYKTYDEKCNACSNFNVAILNQGMFQTTQMDEKCYQEIKTFLEKNKDNIAEINFFYLSESLADDTPIFDIFPLINIYHTSIGITFVDHSNKIIRSAVFQLNFKEFAGTNDVLERFLAPHFCLNMMKDPNTGLAIDPTTMSESDFIDNLFIDYSHSVSALLFSFNETQDYTTEDLVKKMACVNVANLTSSPHIAYSKFVNQNITCQNLYDAYHKQQNGFLKSYQGNADGTIFCLNSYGPSILTSQAGLILNFAKLTNVNKFQDFIDWCFTNLSGCAKDSTNDNLQHYCVLGVDKLTPIDSLSESEYNKIIKKKTIISITDGFIKEAKGRTTHCNTLTAIIITLIDSFSKTDKDWTTYTNWEDKKFQGFNFYMMNPTILNLPLISFPSNWENGVSVKDLNTNPLYKDDKLRFYKLWFFSKMLLNGFTTQAINSVNSTNNIYLNIFNHLKTVFDSSIISNILNYINPNYKTRFNEINSVLLILLLLYIVIKFDLFDTFYWATGQSTSDLNGTPCPLTEIEYPIDVIESLVDFVY